MAERRAILLGLAGLAGGCVTPLELLRDERAVPRVPGRLVRGTACADGEIARTPEIAEGPFYRPRSPRTHWLGEPDAPGERFVLEGRVLDRACRPIAGAVLDLWQADGTGRYDADGQRFRGHQLSDADGRYRFCTVRPGPEQVIGIVRTPHLHLKVWAEGRSLLTTQLYFADERPRNEADVLYDARTRLRLVTSPRLPRARFDFVI
ncbi:MAG: hypothetical protein AB7S26_21720 [Sandaracinaceae bacterium]